MKKNRMNLFLSIVIVLFCTLATVLGMSFDLRSKENFLIISGGVKYIPDWKWSIPYLIFTILAFVTTIVHVVMYTIPNNKKASGSLKKRIHKILIIEILLSIFLIVSGIGLSILGNVKPDHIKYIPLRPWVTSFGVCLSFCFSIILLILNIKVNRVKHEK